MRDVELSAMTEAEFDEFYEGDIRHYADENTASGRWTNEEALELSRRAHEELLPQGRATKNHHLLTARDASGTKIGVVWLALIDHNGSKEAFIYDIEIVEGLRGQGWGSSVLGATEEKARGLGASVMSLHVFCHNKRAFSLYKKAGYKITSANMSKRI